VGGGGGGVESLLAPSRANRNGCCHPTSVVNENE